jgi:hypothetical protein
VDPQQPEDPSDRTITIRLNRETIWLIVAVGALVIVILLAIIVQLGANQTVASPTAPAASAATARPTAPPRATAQARASAAPDQAKPSAAPSRAYPAPQAAPTSAVSDSLALAPSSPALPREGEPGGQGGLQATDAVPTFQPSRPTAQTGLAYPGPGRGALQQTQLPTFPTTAVTPGTTPTSDPLFANDTPTARPTARPAPTAAPPTAAPPTAAPPVAAAPTVARPTAAPRPSATPNRAAADAGPGPGGGGAGGKEPPPAQPAAPPISVLRGNIRWTIAQSPVVVNRTLQLVPGSSLIIDPGVEVRVGPGVGLYIEGALYALGQPGNPVRIVARERGRWDGLYGRPGSAIILENTEIRGGGNGGTLLISEAGTLTMRGVRINDNGGHIRVADSKLEMRDSEIAGNDMPYGAALDAIYNTGGFTTLINNRIGGNRLSAGAPPVQLVNAGALDILNIDIQRNLLIGQTGPDLVLTANGAFLGRITCNTLINGTNGLSILSSLPQVPGMNITVRDNAIEDHVPPIIPIYLKYGIGRGATSAISQDMTNNWWEVESGPYEPDQNADGRGESVGVNIAFRPWLGSRPACAPPRP